MFPMLHLDNQGLQILVGAPYSQINSLKGEEEAANREGGGVSWVAGMRLFGLPSRVLEIPRAIITTLESKMVLPLLRVRGMR